MDDVHAEFGQIFPQSFKCRPATKHFAFHVPGVTVPQTSEYLNVRHIDKIQTISEIS